MSATEKSSNQIPDQFFAESMKIGMVPIESLVLPESLFDSNQAIPELAFFTPLTIWKNGDTFAIIDGCKRYKVLVERGRSECACSIIESEYDTTRAGLLRIALNNGRVLPLQEKLLFLRWLKTNLDSTGYLAQSQKLNIPPNERHELELLLNCSGKLIDAVINGTLDRAVAPEMGHLKDVDVDAMLDLFSSIPFSRQMQRELVEWLYEIAFSKRITVREVLALKRFSEIAAETKLNQPQKAAKFHEIVYACRFPLYAKAKKLWTENSRAMNPDPASISFHANPFFEKRGLEIRIKVGDEEHAELLMKKLALIKTDTWRQLVDPTAFYSVD